MKEKTNSYTVLPTSDAAAEFMSEDILDALWLTTAGSDHSAQLEAAALNKCALNHTTAKLEKLSLSLGTCLWLNRRLWSVFWLMLTSAGVYEFRGLLHILLMCVFGEVFLLSRVAGCPTETGGCSVDWLGKPFFATSFAFSPPKECGHKSSGPPPVWFQWLNLHSSSMGFAAPKVRNYNFLLKCIRQVCRLLTRVSPDGLSVCDRLVWK